MKALKIISLLLIISACGNTDKEISDLQPYEGPINMAEDMVLYRSETATLRVKLVTPKFLEFASGDREFPEGLYMEFFDETGKMTTTLKADEARYFKEEDHWRGRGNVVIKNIE
ncbi:MAG: LPS export ABC transporter periplasmic protein LptC, partial [Fulvivirga sp.]